MNTKKLRALFWVLAACCASAALAAPPTYPFGARLDAYGHGTKPNHITTTQMDDTIRARYADWKTKLLVDVPSVPGGKAVRFNNPDYIAVSEGMGYGMLITVLMAGHDAQAQAIFDGLLTTVRARPAYSIPTVGTYLMDWRLDAEGRSTDAAGGGWSALDGDEDIAMALLMADRQWGSTGTWNYKQQAINTINAMKSWHMKPDGTTKSCPTPDVSRTSDYTIGHFRAFAQATGDTFWSTTAIDRAYWLIDRMQTVYSPGIGLMPDFIVKTDTAAPEPSPGGMCDRTPWEMHYFSNAQRNPWRWATDYVYSGDPRWKAVLTKMMNFFMRDNGGTPGPAVSTWEPIGNMAVGYHLDGTRMNSEFPNPWPAVGLVAGAMNGAQVDPAFQGYLNAAWDWLNAKWSGKYYDAELTLLSMLVASGNWWNPTTGSPPTQPSTRVQAEGGTLSGTGVAVKNDLAGFEGSGFVGNFTSNGDTLTLAFPNLAAGTYTVRIRYHTWTDQQNNVVVNGATRNESFPATGSNWAVKTLSGVALASGSNAIAITKDWGNIDVDWIEVVPTGVTFKMQAESGALSGSGVSVRTDLAGYEGSGFVGSFTTNGDTLTLSTPNVVAGTFTVRIRYHAWTNQQNNVVVNGGVRNESFPATGSDWAVKTLSGVTLAGGSNSIAISKDWGHMDVDWIEIAP